MIVQIQPICQTIFLSLITSPHDKIGSPEHNNPFLRYNVEAPEKRNKSGANFGFSGTKEKQAGRQAGRLRPTQGSQGGPCCIAPGCLLRSPGDLENNARGEGDGNRVLALATVTKLCPGPGEVSEMAARGFRLEFFFQL